MARRHRLLGYSRRRTVYCRWTDNGRAGGAGVGAAVGGLSGALIGMGIPEYEAKQYEGKIKQGNILISVHSEDSDETSAQRNLERAGAHDISSTGEESVPKKDQPAYARS